MADSQYTVWLTQDGVSYLTQYDIVLVANAVDVAGSAYNDTAQYIGNNAVIFDGNTRTTADEQFFYQFFDAYTIALTGDSADLEIGGNYTVRQDNSNIHYAGSPRVARSAQAVYFTGNGILHLTAQNGARTVDVNSGFNDDAIRLVMQGAIEAYDTQFSGGTAWYTYNAADDVSVAVVRAEEELEVSSDLVGAFITSGAAANVSHREADVAAGVYAIQAEKITIDGNYRAQTIVQNSKLVARDVTDYKVDGSYFRINAINSNTDFTSKKAWVNSVVVSGNKLDVVLDGRNAKAKSADIDPFETPDISNNHLSVAALEVSRDRGSELIFDTIGFANGSGVWADYPATFTVKGNDILLWAYGQDDAYEDLTDNAPTAYVSGNTVTTAALNANTITLGSVGTNARFDVAGGTTTFRGELSNGRISIGQEMETIGGTVALNNNKAVVAGLNADAIAIEAFAGTIAVSGGDMLVIAANQNYDDKWKTPGSTLGAWSADVKSNTLTVAGIHAADRMIVSSYFGGDIIVTRGDASAIKSEVKVPGGTETESRISGASDVAYGILTPYLEDEGRIGVNISSGDSNLLDIGINAQWSKLLSGEIVGGTICTDAFSGSITGAVIGVDARNAFVSPYFRVSSETAAGDAIDISGFIGGTGMKYALKVGSTNGSNIRVSGAICVSTDSYVFAAEYGGEIDLAQDDVIEVATNAVFDKAQLAEVASVIAEGGTVYASGDRDTIVIDGVAVPVGTISGGTVTGQIRLGKSASTNWAIISTQSTMGTTTEKARFVGNEGNLNLAFQLDGKAQDHAVYLTDFNDASMTSTTAIGINCDNAKSGDTYKLIEYDQDISSKWESRKVSFVWRGEEKVADFNPAVNTPVTVAFADGTTATLEMVSVGDHSVLQATVNKSAYAAKQTTLDVDLVVEKWNFADNSYTINWKNCDWSNAMANMGFYEIEYSINGGNTIVTRLNKNQKELTINQVLAGDVILWRIRGVDINLQNAGYYSKETQWSRYLGQACAESEQLPSVDMSSSFADASGQYSRDASRVNGAAALVYWDPAVATNTTVDHYVVEYVESLDKKSDLEAKALLESGAATSVKWTSDTSVMLTSLTTRCYIYWRVKAVDVYGNESGYVMGEEFRVFDGDSIAPTFTDSNVGVYYARNVDASKVDITVTWAYAEDFGSGVKYYRVTLTDENGVSQSKTCDRLGNLTNYALTFSGIAKGNYTVTVIASDYSKNSSRIYSTPAAAPTLDDEAFSVNYTKADANYVTLKVDFNQAVSPSGIAIDNYVVTVWQKGVAVYTQTITDNGSSHYTTTFGNKIFAVGEYDVTIQAYDLAQNASETLSQSRICGAIALNGNWGEITKQPEIVATYTEEYVEQPGSYSYFDTQTGQIVNGGTVCVKHLTDASATFTWEDTFSNARGVHYALDFSDTADFSGTVYTYYTENADVVYEGGTRTATLNQDAARPVAILAEVSGGTAGKTIYWRLRAGGKDDSGFVSSATSGVYSFKFNYADGTPITYNVAPAKAVAFLDQPLAGSGTAAQVSDGKLYVTIATEKTDLGIEGYEITLKNQSNSAFSYTWSVNYNSDLIVATDDTYNTFSKTFDLTQIFGNVNYDGTYTMTVKTLAGGMATTTSEVIINESVVSKFAVDTIAPTKVTGVTAQSFASGVLVSWNASSDASGIQSYIIKGRVAGSSIWQDMITVKGSVTSEMVSGLSNNTYQFAVCAVDNNGNVSEYSEVSTANVYTETDYEDFYVPDKWITYSAAQFTASNTIGSADKADYFCINCDVACTLSMNLASLMSVSGSKGIKIALYKYDGTGKEKAIKSFSVSSEKALLSNYALDAGEYFVKVTASQASAINAYSLNFTKQNYSTAQYNNTGDNVWYQIDETRFAPLSTANAIVDWVGFGDDVDYRRINLSGSGNYSINLKSSGDPATVTLYQAVNGKLVAINSISTSAAGDFNTMQTPLDDRNVYYIGVTSASNAQLKSSDYMVSLNLNYAYEGPKVSHADDTAALASVNYAALSMTNATVQEWIGFSDSIDYRRLYLEHGGNYNLRLSNVTAASTLTLYQEINGTLQKIQSITIDPAIGRSATGKIGNIWLDSSANATYYVSMEAVNAASEQNTNYLLNLSAFTVYSEGAHNDDDTATLAAMNYAPLTLGSSVTGEWVGFGDTIDYRRIGLNYSGSYQFTISGVENDVTLAIWQNVGGNLALVNAVTVEEGTFTLYQQLDSANEYFISVSCNECDASHNSHYALAMTGTEFPRAKHGDDWSDLAVNGKASAEYGTFGTLTDNNKGLALTRWDDVSGEKGEALNWLSYGDEVDYVSFTINSSAKLNFNLTTAGSLGAQLSINELQSSNGVYYLNELGSVDVYASTGSTEVWLQKGTYYVAIEALNAAAGGCGDYAVSLGAQSVFFTKSNTGNTDSTLADAQQHQTDPWHIDAAGTTQSDWIGFGNAADYWKLQLCENNGGKLKITLDDPTTYQAYQEGKIALSLFDGNSQAVGFVQKDNAFTTELSYSDGKLFYFGISCVDETGKSFQTDYSVKFSIVVNK